MAKYEKLRARALGNPLVLALLLLPFFKPDGLIWLVPALDIALTAWKAGALVCILALWAIRPRLSKMGVALGLYYCLVVGCNFLNRFRYDSLFFLIVNLAGLVLLLESCIHTDVKALLKALVYLLGVLCVANLATVLAFPNGMSGAVNYLMGMDNSHSLFFLPLMGLGMIYTTYKRRGLALKLCLLALFSASMYITWSASAVVGASVFIILALAYELKLRFKFCNIGLYYALILVMFLALVIFRAQNIFAFFIENVLKKDLTLTYRTDLWDASLGLIAERPLLGHGMISFAAMTKLIGNINCHSLILQVLFDTGIIGLAVYLVVMGLLIKPLMRRKDHYVCYYLAAALFSLLLVLTVESLVYPLPFYTICILAYHADELITALDAPPVDEGTL